MKAVALCVLLALAIQIIHADNFNYEEGDLVFKLITRSVIGDKIKDFLESFKEKMKNGDESMGIPVVDPLYIEEQVIDVEHELINATGQVNDLELEGLSEFEVLDADFKLGTKKFSIHLQWPTLKGETSFNDLDAKIMDYIPLYGSGGATFEVSNLTFATNAKVKLDLKNKNITLVEFQGTTILLDALTLDAKGLYGDEEMSEYISSIISQIAPGALVDFQEELVTEVNALMLELGNELLPTVVDTIWGIIMPQYL